MFIVGIAVSYNNQNDQGEALAKLTTISLYKGGALHEKCVLHLKYYCLLC